MSKYSDRQLNAVVKLQALHGVPGRLTAEACEEYLDWYLSECSAEARGITSIGAAMADGSANGLSIHERQFRKLSELAQ